MPLHKLSGDISRGFQVVIVGNKAVHYRLKIRIVLYLEAALCAQQSLCLLKALVVRSEDYGDVPNCRFEHIVDAYAESSAHV